MDDLFQMFVFIYETSKHLLLLTRRAWYTNHIQDPKAAQPVAPIRPTFRDQPEEQVPP